METLGTKGGPTNRFEFGTPKAVTVKFNDFQLFCKSQSVNPDGPEGRLWLTVMVMVMVLVTVMVTVTSRLN
jgi:hypothetical protein